MEPQSFILLLKLTISLDFWPQMKKKCKFKKVLAERGAHCPLETEAEQGMAGK